MRQNTVHIGCGGSLHCGFGLKNGSVPWVVKSCLEYRFPTGLASSISTKYVELDPLIARLTSLKGFWKRSGWVCRLSQRIPNPAQQASPDAQNILTSDGKVFCHDPGPRLIFRSLLDSGATFASLFTKDLRALGINKMWYGAQSCSRFSTSNGHVLRRIYELHVEIAQNEGTPLVDPNNPVHPRFPPYIGGLQPVSENDVESLIDENGNDLGLRLSGVTPFVAPYLSSTPCDNMLLLGENRNDVVGGHKMPAARKWEVGLSQYPSSRENWNRWGDPRSPSVTEMASWSIRMSVQLIRESLSIRGVLSSIKWSSIQEAIGKGPVDQALSTQLRTKAMSCFRSRPLVDSYRKMVRKCLI